MQIMKKVSNQPKNILKIENKFWVRPVPGVTVFLLRVFLWCAAIEWVPYPSRLTLRWAYQLLSEAYLVRVQRIALQRFAVLQHPFIVLKRISQNKYSKKISLTSFIFEWYWTCETPAQQNYTNDSSIDASWWVDLGKNPKENLKKNSTHAI